MKRALLICAAAITLGAVTGCTEDEVKWGDYDSALQGRIDDLATAKDCAGLQTEFDNADANSTATKQRTGHTNAALMSYIDGKLKDAGCHD